MSRSGFTLEAFQTRVIDDGIAADLLCGAFWFWQYRVAARRP